MTDIDREQRIRARAYEIWEGQGRPEGRQNINWDQARREIEMESEDAEGLNETLVETIGLAVGAEPDDTYSPDNANQEPDEIDRESSQLGLERQEGSRSGRKPRRTE